MTDLTLHWTQHVKLKAQVYVVNALHVVTFTCDAKAVTLDKATAVSSALTLVTTNGLPGRASVRYSYTPCCLPAVFSMPDLGTNAAQPLHT